jgi:beta-glucanase (GH16 family)
MPKRQSLKAKIKNGSNKIVFAIAVVAIGIVGSIFIVLSHAATPPNCGIVQGVNKNLQFCTNISSFNYLNALATYTGETSSDIITSGSLSLYQCTKAVTPVCSVVASTNTVLKPNVLFGRKYAQLKTTSVQYDTNSVYKSCVTFTSTTGLSASNNCTQIVTWGSGAGESPRVYQQAAPTVPTTTSATGNSTTSTTSTNTTTTQVQPAPMPTCGNQVVADKSDGSKWQCTFSDEFDGTALNRILWSPMVSSASNFATTDTGNNNPRGCFMDNPHNVSVSGGYLNLTAYQEPAPFTCQTKTPFTTSYTVGEVHTLNKFSQQYGRFEVKAKLPSSAVKGLQETFWLWPNNAVKYGAWPGSGEFDIAEFYSKYNNLNVPIAHYNVDPKTVNFTNHINTYTPVIYYDNNFNNCYFNLDTFNTYTAFWRSGYLEVDVNGKPCLVDTYSATNGANPTPFDQPFFFALTQAIGINAGADNQFVPGTTPLPATTQVDYVHIWK